MTPEIIIILVLAVLCGVLAAGIIRLWYINRDITEMYTETDKHVAVLISENKEFVIENLKLTEKLNIANEDISDLLKQLDTLRAENEKLFDVAMAGASDAAEDPPEIISEPEAARSVPEVDWTFEGRIWKP